MNIFTEEVQQELIKRYGDGTHVTVTDDLPVVTVLVLRNTQGAFTWEHRDDDPSVLYWTSLSAYNPDGTRWGPALWKALEVIRDWLDLDIVIPERMLSSRVEDTIRAAGFETRERERQLAREDGSFDKLLQRELVGRMENPRIWEWVAWRKGEAPEPEWRPAFTQHWT